MRVAVIGTGYLGRFHAEKYRDSPRAELVGVVDPLPDARQSVAAACGTKACADFGELLGHVDAVSVVTPTPLHHRIARAFIDAGAHVLVEKPMCTTVDEARDLIAAAKINGRVLQVGHLERFNPAVLAAMPGIRAPRFIESHRLAPFRPRGTDVSVVLDLMIHDIDLIMNIVGARIGSIDAVGAPVFTGEIDIANARIRFENGCVANVTASRISTKSERKLRVFQEDSYLSLDLQLKTLTTVRRRPDAAEGNPPAVDVVEQDCGQGDALGFEIDSFLSAIAANAVPVVTGEDGLRALETALRIGDLVRRAPSGAPADPR
ncbi:MAG: Gfo/Idh/MocA family oxidoreductase [Steroidobacteraceae bacterium]|mgnify:CR=1 FL=1